MNSTTMTIVFCELPNVSFKEIQDDVVLIDSIEEVPINFESLIREKEITRLRALSILMIHLSTEVFHVPIKDLYNELLKMYAIDRTKMSLRMLAFEHITTPEKACIMRRNYILWDHINDARSTCESISPMFIADLWRERITLLESFIDA
jgi:hypothetical protein